MTNQNVDASFGYNRRLSPTRQLQYQRRWRGTHVSTLNALDRSDLSYWMPSGSGSVSLDVGRSWSIAADYSRAASVLQGVSLTSFATDSASASVSGLINSRIEASLSAIYSNGRSGGADTSGRFENYSGSLQFRYAISRCCATTVNYDYYVYRFEDVVDLPSDFPSRLRPAGHSGRHHDLAAPLRHLRRRRQLARLAKELTDMLPNKKYAPADFLRIAKTRAALIVVPAAGRSADRADCVVAAAERLPGGDADSDRAAARA